MRNISKKRFIAVVIAASLVCASVSFFILKFEKVKTASVKKETAMNAARYVSEASAESVLYAIEKVYNEKTKQINAGFDKFYKIYDSKNIKVSDSYIETTSPGGFDVKLNPINYAKEAIIKDKDVTTTFLYNVKVETGLHAIYYAKTNVLGDLALVASTLDLNRDFDYFKIDSKSSGYSNIVKEVFFGKKAYVSAVCGSDSYVIGFSKVADYRGEIVGVLALAAWVNKDSEFEKIFSRFDANRKVAIMAVKPEGKLYSIYPETKELATKDFSFLSDRPIKNSGDIKSYENSIFDFKNKNNLGSRAYFKPLDWYVLSDYNLSELSALYTGKTSFWSVGDFAIIFLVLILSAVFAIIMSKLYENYSNNFKNNYSPVFKSIALLADKRMREADETLPDVNFNKPDLNEYETIIKNVWTVCENFIEIGRDNQDIIETLEEYKEETAARIKELSNKLQENEIETNEIKREMTSENEFLKSELTDLTSRFNKLTDIYKTSVFEFENLKSTALAIIAGIKEDDSNKKEDAVKELIDRLHYSASAKFNILKDKIDKILFEVNSIKTVSDRAFLLSVNSAIIAEKANAQRLTSFASEIKKIADKTISSADKFNYLVNELRYAVDALETDYRRAKHNMEDKAGYNHRNGSTPVKRGIPELINEIDRASASISLLTKTAASQIEGK